MEISAEGLPAPADADANLEKIDHTKADGEAGGRFLAALEHALTQLPNVLTR